MGDRSPKANQKKASQKQSVADAANKKKQSIINDHLAAKAKLASGKKK